ncbi:MAG: tetratricopeptide repeat protein [Betaproteobacteria bacterium]|nr:tetratricopeptide repeat protein [Betaproteobacteria bacterium]
MRRIATVHGRLGNLPQARSWLEQALAVFEEIGDASGTLRILGQFAAWWECGRSYLCRMIDMLHMGYVDEVIFGKEVTERIPDLVHEWIDIAGARS